MQSSANTFIPNTLPSIYVSRFGTPIVVDAEIKEAAWNTATRATGFSEVFPGDQSKPPIEVSARIGYDDDNLYVAFTVQDEPSSIRANLSDRDAIWQDDYVGLVLDPNGDGEAMYFIASNPLGIQGDSRISPQNEDEGFNLIYQSAGKVTDTGYQVEMAIPFRSLRFPANDVQSWRATFWITHPRESRSQYSWAALDRDNPCWSCQLGTLTGMSNIRAGRNLEILPALTGAGAGALTDGANPASTFDNDRVQLEPSINLKYGITSDLTVDATVNPDFSQIESDDAQVDVNTRFALFFRERRPFFQEGSDLFRTELQTVYTRSINEPIAATKLTGRLGKTSVAYIGARDNQSPLLLPFEEESNLLSAGKSFSNIVRVKHSLGQNKYIGALATDRRLDRGGAGSTVGIDGSVRFLEKYILTGQFVTSRSAEPTDTELSKETSDLTFGDQNYTAALDGERFWGHGLSAELDREGRYWGFEVGYKERSPTFRADNGFVRQNNNRRLFLWQGVTLYPEKVLPFVDRIRPMIIANRIWNFDNVRKEDAISPAVHMMLKRQTQLFVRYGFERELYNGVQFDGIRRLIAEVSSNFSNAAHAGVSVVVGRDIARSIEVPELGRSLDWSVFAIIRPSDRISFQPRLLYSRLQDLETGEEFFSGYILRTRLGYQFSRRLFIRTIVQYNDFSKGLEIDPLLTYKVNAFTAFYIGSTHDFGRFDRLGEDPDQYFRQSSRQIFFKFQYLFRR